MAAGRHDLGGLVRPLPVAGHDLRAAHGDLAGRAGGHGAALVVDQQHVGAGQGQADVAAVGAGVHGAAGHGRAGLGQAVALADGTAGLLQPQQGRAGLHGHRPAHAEPQAAPVDLAHIGVPCQRFEQRVDRREAVHAVARQHPQHALGVLRVGDQQRAAPQVQSHQHHQREAVDVVQRQRAHRQRLLPRRDVAQRRAIPGFGLQQVGHQVAVQQHGTLARGGGAAGVLQRRDVVGTHRHGGQDLVAAAVQRGREADGAGQRVGRHQALHAAHPVVDQRALQRPEQVAHRGHDDALGGHGVDHLGQRGCGGLHDHDDARAAVAQLMGEPLRAEQRVDVDHHQPGAQHGRRGHQHLRHVGQHQRHPVAAGQPQALQVGGEGLRQVVDLAEAQRAAHAQAGRQRAVRAEAAFEHRHQGRGAIGPELRRHRCRVLPEPEFVHRCSCRLRRILTPN